MTSAAHLCEHRQFLSLEKTILILLAFIIISSQIKHNRSIPTAYGFLWWVRGGAHLWDGPRKKNKHKVKSSSALIAILASMNRAKPAAESQESSLCDSNHYSITEEIVSPMYCWVFLDINAEKFWTFISDLQLAFNLGNRIDIKLSKAYIRSEAALLAAENISRKSITSFFSAHAFSAM